MRLVIALIASIVAAAAARADIAYSVYGVRPGDTLNMRVAPYSNAMIVQAIPYNAEGITLTGQSAQNEWVEVNFQRKRGWVNGRFLGLGPSGRYQVPAFLECFGTEPFWSISLRPGTARADLLFVEKRYVFRLTRAQQAMNRTDVMLIKGSSQPGEMSLIVRQEVCNDGMSDNRYPYFSIAMISGLNMVAGCCRPAVPR